MPRLRSRTATLRSRAATRDAPVSAAIGLHIAESRSQRRANAGAAFALASRPHPSEHFQQILPSGSFATARAPALASKTPMGSVCVLGLGSWPHDTVRQKSSRSHLKRPTMQSDLGLALGLLPPSTERKPRGSTPGALHAALVAAAKTVCPAAARSRRAAQPGSPRIATLAGTDRCPRAAAGKKARLTPPNAAYSHKKGCW